ncbi:hypothetical protein L9F63_000306, partial [Diploptera punctata]
QRQDLKTDTGISTVAMKNRIQISVIIFVALLFAANFKESDEARILGLGPLPGTSHMIANTAVLKELAARGHDVTVITPFQPEKPIPNYRVIPLKKITFDDLMQLDNNDGEEKSNMNPFEMQDMSIFMIVFMLWGFGEAICDISLAEESVQKLINSNEKFDLIIMEAFYTNCFLGFAHKFNAPVVQFSAFGGTEEVGDLVGNPSPYSYVPDPLQELSDKMTFTERLRNTIGLLFQKLAKKYFDKGQDKIMRKHFNDPNMPSIEELEKRTALVLVNHHFSISYPRPMAPNFVQVGGLHVKPPKKLPADLQKYMDDAPDGVIYFSMGSNLQSTDMPEETVKTFTGAFSKLKQKVIWKWETDSLPGKSANLKVAKWLPQSDILAHPNVRLFITHGGLLSTEETVHRGVPVVGIPIFGDQRLNMKKTESLGFGKLLEYKNITENSLLSSIKEVLENPKYRENAQRLSRIFRDQPMTPMEQAVFWTEYVIRHKGAPHMRSAALDLTCCRRNATPVVVFVALLLAGNIKEGEGARILGLFPLPATSHMIATSTLVKELANRGHDVTVITPFKPEKPIPNYKVIPLTLYTVDDLRRMAGGNETVNPFEGIEITYIERILMMWGFGAALCNLYLAEESVQHFMNSNEQFDVIILEAFFTDCFLGFAHKFKAPVIQISAFGGTENLGNLVGNPSPYSYVPDPFQEFGDKMSFSERLANSVGQLLQKVAKRYFVRGQNEVMRKYFKDPNMPSIEELEKWTALVLVNHHFSISYPKPLVPNFVQVGGLHVKPPKKLPADLQKYIDDAPDGVIYFSMGSNLKSSNMREETVRAFTGAFSKLKQRIIWKWEADSIPGQPPNLKLAKWLPQSDILAHPNVRLFITHGGLLSTQETVDRGVPIIGIPIFGDQRLNMKRCESLGFGKLLEFKNITEESILSTLNEVLHNPKYRENAKRLSRIYKDQPLTPLQQAVFWTEYIIRHKGAPHMRSAALDLTWYQYFLLDVIAVLILASLTILIILFVIIRAIFRLVCRKSKPKLTSKKKKN